MNRWQIGAIYLYSHDGRRVELKLELSAVNILTGVCYSGKSALVEVIDYCLGASDCHIPGIVRDASSWVGVLWRREKADIFVCRRVPREGQDSSDEVYFTVGAPVEVPKSALLLKANTNRDGGLRQFEQALQMGDVSGETFTEREGRRVSFRHAVPYLLQSDDVIVNKTLLLRGTNDQRRLHIADALPYFIGAVDESTAAAEFRLTQLKAKRDRELRKVDAAARVQEREVDRALILLREAAQLGMIDELPQDLPPDVVVTMLQGVAGWVSVASAVAEVDQLKGLQATERELRQRYANLRRQLDAANVMIESAAGFRGTVERQQQRLDVVRLFRPTGERDVCPVCTSRVSARTPTLENIEKALHQLDTEMDEVSRDRPKIDGYAKQLSENLLTVGRELEKVRSQTAAIIRETDALRQQAPLDERRLRVAGRVSYYLEERDSASTAVDRTALQRLEKDLRELESEANPAAKAERLEALQNQVSMHATEILRKLPFDPHYENCQILFNVRRLDIRFVLGRRVMEMRDVGGDESYLSGHVATLLALHRVFDDGERPVPGVLVFDQLSRPFFPADKFRDEVEVRGDDRKDLKTYFEVLFNEVATRKTLQVIVLEHALFADDSQYLAAVRARWTNESKLIPEDWPKVSSAASPLALKQGPVEEPSDGGA